MAWQLRSVTIISMFLRLPWEFARRITVAQSDSRYETDQELQRRRENVRQRLIALLTDPVGALAPFEPRQIWSDVPSESPELAAKGATTLHDAAFGFSMFRGHCARRLRELTERQGEDYFVHTALYPLRFTCHLERGQMNWVLEHEMPDDLRALIVAADAALHEAAELSATISARQLVTRAAWATRPEWRTGGWRTGWWMMQVSSLSRHLVLLVTSAVRRFYCML